MKNKFVLLMIGVILLFSLVVAIQISNFEGYGAAENLTFTGDENITRSISIYRYANVTGAFINLSGKDYEIINNTNFLFNEDSSINFIDIAEIDSTHFLVTYEGKDSDAYTTVVIINKTNWTVTSGSEYEYDTVYGFNTQVKKINDTHYLTTYMGDSFKAYASILIVDTTDWSITSTTPYNFDDNGQYHALEKIDDLHYINAYYGSSEDGTATILTINLTDLSISEGTNYIFENEASGGAEYMDISQINSTHYLIVWQRGTGADDDAYANVLIVNTSLWTISSGTEYEFDTTFGKYFNIFNISNTTFLVSYEGSGDDGKAVILSVNLSSLAITSGLNHTFESGENGYNYISQISETKYLNTYTGADGDSYGVFLIVNLTDLNITSEGLMEIDNNKGSSPITKKIDTFRFLNIYGGISSGNVKILNISMPIDNPYIQLNNTNIWSYTGEFNSTFSPNKTDDFYTTLNNSFNFGACDCTGCSLSGNNCTINFTIHSDTAGILEYSNIEIDWEEYSIPNATIINPIGSKSSRTVTYTVNISDDWATDVCRYWVTRGASVEIANTTISCGDQVSDTFVVSSDASYVFHFLVNDTSGNTNKSTSNFSVDTSYTPEIGGGSGGSTIIVVGQTNETSWTMGTDSGTGKYTLIMIRDSSRNKDIIFENTGTSERVITLECEEVDGDFCDYITLDETTINLPVKKDTKTAVSFKIDLPKYMDKGSYSFNIRATDDLDESDIISIDIEIGTGSFLVNIGAKLFSSKNIGGLYVPYLSIFLFFWIIISILSFFSFYKKSKGGKVFSFFTGLGIAFTIIAIL